MQSVQELLDIVHGFHSLLSICPEIQEKAVFVQQFHPGISVILQLHYLSAQAIERRILAISTILFQHGEVYLKLQLFHLELVRTLTNNACARLAFKKKFTKEVRSYKILFCLCVWLLVH